MRFTYQVLQERREMWQMALEPVADDLLVLSRDDHDWDDTEKRKRFAEILGAQHRLAVGQAINPCPKRATVTAPKARKQVLHVMAERALDEELEIPDYQVLEEIEDYAKSLNTLAKYNGGLWKSQRQAGFLADRIRALQSYGQETRAWAERQGLDADKYIYLDVPRKLPYAKSRKSKVRYAYQGFVIDDYGLLYRIKAKVQHPTGGDEEGTYTYHVRQETAQVTFEREGIGEFRVDATGAEQRAKEAVLRKKYASLAAAMEKINDIDADWELKKLAGDFTYDMEMKLKAGEKLTQNQMAVVLRVLKKAGLVPPEWAEHEPDAGEYEAALEKFITWVNANTQRAGQQADAWVGGLIKEAQDAKARSRRKLPEVKREYEKWLRDYESRMAAGEREKPHDRSNRDYYERQIKSYSDTSGYDKYIRWWRTYDYKKEFRSAWKFITEMPAKRVKARTYYPAELYRDWPRVHFHTSTGAVGRNPVDDAMQDIFEDTLGSTPWTHNSTGPSVVDMVADYKYGIRAFAAGKRVRKRTMKGLGMLVKRMRKAK